MASGPSSATSGHSRRRLHRRRREQWDRRTVISFMHLGSGGLSWRAPPVSLPLVNLNRNSEASEASERVEPEQRRAMLRAANFG